MMMVPGGVGEAMLEEACFMYNQEKGLWYHQEEGRELGEKCGETCELFGGRKFVDIFF